MTGDKEYGGRRGSQQPQLFKQLQAVHAPQLDIGDHQRRAGQGERPLTLAWFRHECVPKISGTAPPAPVKENRDV